MKRYPVVAARSARLLELYPKAQYLGDAPLPASTCVVGGITNDWVLVPAPDDPQVKMQHLHCPRYARRAVRQLARSGAPVSALYIAHEVPRGAVARLASHGLDKELETAPSASNEKLAARLDRAGRLMLKTLTPLVTSAGAIALAAGALATSGLDPAVLAAVAASDRPQPGDAAAFFHIVSWK